LTWIKKDSERPSVISSETPYVAEIEFKDNGSGIDPGNTEKVFLPFFTTKHKGFGLGLSIAKRIIEDHKGTISLCSEGKEGCSIKIRLPVRAGRDHEPKK
jgi:signal transduction histidine kinase